MSSSPIFSSPFARNGIPLASTPSSEITSYFNDALELANKALQPQGIELVLIQHVDPQQPHKEFIDPSCDLLLGIKLEGTEEVEPIDILDVKALQEDQIKTPIDLHKEMLNKVGQHLLAKTTSGIAFSASGSKFDTRKLQDHTFTIDPQGYARMDSHRLAMETPKGEFFIVPADRMRSYTILRLIEEGEGIIRITDDHDPVRSNSRGMFVNTSTVHQITVDKLLPRCQDDAKDYDNNYLLIQRDTLTQDTKERIYSVLQTFKP